ncbi:LacI family DNA-binding transcriptional regulator [Terribacillus saccharophilus]|uniref:LacI family DNA-binding transcriptional regulator n=1 Tax=Terribacillus saccharophilus TaxID=361277 RepID=UPI0039829083
MKTIADIADLAGVSKSTVSRYLNGGSVSTATKKKLERIINEQNYVPNTFAQSLKAKKTAMIGIIVPRLDSFAASHTMMGIDDSLRKQGYQLLIASANQEVSREIEAIHNFTRQKVAGIILMSTQITGEHLQAIKEAKIPTLLVGQQHHLLPSLIHDDYEAGRIMGDFVVKQGHRNIIYLGVTERDIAVGIERKRGFREALQHNGCHADYLETSFRMHDAMELAQRLLSRTEATVIVGATDNIALGIIKAAHQLNLRIPDDISIAGFGGYDTAEIVSPALTTVTYDYLDAGKKAGEKIVQLVEDETCENLTIYPVQLKKRESVDKI